MLTIKLDTKPAIRTFACMEKQLAGFVDDQIADELLDWDKEDLHKRRMVIVSEDKTSVSADMNLGEDEESLKPDEMNALTNRFDVLMRSALNWRCITLPKRDRFRAPKGGAEWMGWELEWIRHRRAEFKLRYGQRWRKVLYATAYNRFRHRYPHG
jgi:hypothetical protein